MGGENSSNGQLCSVNPAGAATSDYPETVLACPDQAEYYNSVINNLPGLYCFCKPGEKKDFLKAGN